MATRSEMKIEWITLRRIRNPFGQPYVTTFNSQPVRNSVLVTPTRWFDRPGGIRSRRRALFQPGMAGTTPPTARGFIVPRVPGREFESPAEFRKLPEPIRGNMYAGTDHPRTGTLRDNPGLNVITGPGTLKDFTVEQSNFPEQKRT